MDDVKKSNQRNLIFVVLLLVIVMLITVFSGGDDEALSFNTVGFCLLLSVADEDAGVEEESVSFLYTDIVSAEYLDYLPTEVTDNAFLNRNIYKGESLYEGEPCYCYLSSKVEAACVVRTEDVVLIFNMESPDVTESLCEELLGLAEGSTGEEAED